MLQIRGLDHPLVGKHVSQLFWWGLYKDQKVYKGGGPGQLACRVYAQFPKGLKLSSRSLDAHSLNTSENKKQTMYTYMIPDNEKQ